MKKCVYKPELKKAIGKAMKQDRKEDDRLFVRKKPKEKKK
jgi:hypothetical protein